MKSTHTSKIVDIIKDKKIYHVILSDGAQFKTSKEYLLDNDLLVGVDVTVYFNNQEIWAIEPILEKGDK